MNGKRNILNKKYFTMQIHPENKAFELINKTGNIDSAQQLCVQMIQEEEEWLKFFHLSEYKNVRAANEKITYWLSVKKILESIYKGGYTI